MIPYFPQTVVRILQAQEALKKAEKKQVSLRDHLAAIRAANKSVFAKVGKKQPKAGLL